MTPHEQQAYNLGVEAAKSAASWIIDGNTTQGHIARVLAMMDNGDPAAEQFLPACPDLSGEWADSMTPQRLWENVCGDGTPDETTNDLVCDAYETGVADTFEPECERILRAALGLAPPAPLGNQAWRRAARRGWAIAPPTPQRKAVA